MDWAPREAELGVLLDELRTSSGPFNCLVPVSGGKDGSYVAHQLKHVHGMRPLCVTVRPALEREVGRENLRNFIDSGFDHIHVSPDEATMRRLNRIGFEELGFPYYGWLTAILTSVIRVALNFDVPMIFYGEDGEVEYGGTSETEREACFSMDYMRRVYLEGGHERVLNQLEDVHDAYWWDFPSTEEVEGRELRFTHWSYFEPWDSYRNYLVAKEHCGLEENRMPNQGTFTNFAQNDQDLYPLHAYLMYLKFGFGRATQDVGIEIRRGAMTRDQGLNLVRLYDGHYPEELIPAYLDYYGMSAEQFDAVLNRHVNRELFVKRDGRWVPTFRPE